MQNCILVVNSVTYITRAPPFRDQLLFSQEWVLITGLTVLEFPFSAEFGKQIDHFMDFPFSETLNFFLSVHWIARIYLVLYFQLFAMSSEKWLRKAIWIKLFYYEMYLSLNEVVNHDMCILIYLDLHHLLMTVFLMRLTRLCFFNI